MGLAILPGSGAAAGTPPAAGTRGARPEAGAPAAPAPAPAPVKGPAPGKETPKKTEFFGDKEKPDPHYDQGDRVDPFTLGKPPMPATVAPTPPPGDGGDLPAEDDPWGIKLHGLRRSYVDTEVQLSLETKDRFTKIVSECGKQAVVVQNDIRELLKKEKETAAGKYLSSFQTMLEKFQRLEATAKRLQVRQDVESDFASKKVKVQGIVWRPQSPTAAVDGQMVSEGTVIQVGGDKGGMAQVYRIGRDSVVFVYRGIQVTAYLQRGSH
jgi:hypothetical protein